MPKLNSIQAMRGLAAMLVLIFHIGDLSTPKDAPPGAWDFLWHQGFAGVDLFFVISGFIMVYVTQNTAPSAHSAGSFLSKRFTRIYPLWWFYAAVMALYFQLSYGQPAPPDLVTSENALSYLVRSLLLWPQSTFPVLSVGWTLIHEVLFYVAFALTLLMPRRYLFVCLGLWAILIIGTAYPFLKASPARDFYSLLVSPLNLEFILGALAASLSRHSQARFGRSALAIGAFALIAALVIGTDLSAANFTIARVIKYGLPAALIIYGLANLERAQPLATPRWAAALGDWSYSLYLSHLIVLLAIRRIWQSLSPSLPEPVQYLAPGALDNILFAAIALPSCILLAGLSFRYIETPLIRLSRRRLIA